MLGQPIMAYAGSPRLGESLQPCLLYTSVQVSFRGGPEGSVSLIRQAAELRGFGEHVEAELVSFGEETAEGRLEVGGF